MSPTTIYHLDIAEYPVSSLVKIVADLLESIIETNDKLIITNDASAVTHFHSRAVPNIGIYSYLTRILKFASFSNEVLLSLLVYFDRIAKLEKAKYAVNSLTVHRLLITSIVVASKFTSDVFYPNTRYAKVGGLPLYELNQLELEFLFLCNFDLHVKLEDMQAYGDQLLTHAFTQQCTLAFEDEHIKIITSSLSPPLSPSTSATSSYSPSPTTSTSLPLKRKRPDEVINTTTKIQKSEALLDQALIQSVTNTKKSTLLCNNIYSPYSSSQHHSDTIISPYTHGDC
ncbi:cyclin-domain-containing protein [Helicostylum pulchrum]|nr:cyclin-domain-containing protein [Helicostylum pulchrum]